MEITDDIIGRYVTMVNDAMATGTVRLGQACFIAAHDVLGAAVVSPLAATTVDPFYVDGRIVSFEVALFGYPIFGKNV